jgi:hypothetical protein
MPALEAGNPFHLESICREGHYYGLQQPKRSGHVVETIHRFGKLAVDELNGHRRALREPKKDFAKLMIGLIGCSFYRTS